jgi:hypothetical protein
MQSKKSAVALFLQHDAVKRFFWGNFSIKIIFGHKKNVHF